ncbi:MAG: cytochrome c-type biogenesis protein CcmH [Gemmatimonadales bacterium]
MKRRDFLRDAGRLAAAGLVLPGLRAQQDSARGPADPLMAPSWAGGARPEVRAMDNDETVRAIEYKLRCTCGCGLDVFTCRTTDFTCTYSPELHRELVQLLEAGTTPDQAIEAFVAKYGESILMAPKAKGFGAVGYLLPGSLVLVAGAILAWVLLRRDRPEPAPAPAAGPVERPEASRVTDQEMAQVERALRELES